MQDTIDAATLLNTDWPPPILVGYTTRDLLTYALGIGCSDLRYVHEDCTDFAAFPTYPAVLGFKGDAIDVVSFPSPAMMQQPMPMLPGTRVVLDAERYIECVRPLPTEGASLSLRTKLVGVLQKGKGAVIQTESELVDSDDQLLYRLQAASFAVGATGFTSAGVSHSAAIEAPARPPDAEREQRVSEAQAQLYRLSGDYNPLHVDPAIAQMSGFDRPILHGLCSLGFAVRAVLDECAGGDASRFRCVRARFAAPVLPGQTLTTRMWRTSAPGAPTRVVFETVVAETGATAIKHAYVDLVAQDGESAASRL